MSNNLRRATCLALCALAFAACGDDDGGSTTADMGTPPPPPVPPPTGDMGPAVDTGPTTDSGPSGPPTCAEYCGVVMAACTGDNQQYQSADLCMEWCSTNYGWPVGNRDETTGNSLACRLYHSTVASMGGEMADTHCPHGGPSGGDLCGSYCENYCYLALRNCTMEPLYMNMDGCMTACAMFDATGEPNAPNGNTVQCRLYHAGVAGGDDEAEMTHCPHAAQMPSDLCI
ncbi:MAG: hypothetical protein IT379_22415 [Deltaproteobacteria bacterium]|nr:hypothetical protein [Deltaproteobacteria bacterium]